MAGDWQCHERFVKGPAGKIDQTFVADFNGDGLADTIDVESPVSAKVCLSTGDGAFEFHDWYVHWSTRRSRSGSIERAPDQLLRRGEVPELDRQRRCRRRRQDHARRLQRRRPLRPARVEERGQRMARMPVDRNQLLRARIGRRPPLTASNPDLFQQIVTGDFDGDGKTDFIYMPEGAPVKPARAFAGTGHGDVITRITTGLGAVTEITYKPLTDPEGLREGQRRSRRRCASWTSSRRCTSCTDRGEHRARRGAFHHDLFLQGPARAGRRAADSTGSRRSAAATAWGSSPRRVFRRLEGAENYADAWPLMGRPKEVRKYAPAVAGYMAPDSERVRSPVRSSLFGGNLRLVNRSTSTWAVRRSQTCSGGVICRFSGAHPPDPRPDHPIVYEVNLTGSVDETFELNGSALASITYHDRVHRRLRQSRQRHRRARRTGTSRRP